MLHACSSLSMILSSTATMTLGSSCTYLFQIVMSSSFLTVIIIIIGRGIDKEVFSQFTKKFRENSLLRKCEPFSMTIYDCYRTLRLVLCFMTEPHRTLFQSNIIVISRRLYQLLDFIQVYYCARNSNRSALHKRCRRLLHHPLTPNLKLNDQIIGCYTTASASRKSRFRAIIVVSTQQLIITSNGDDLVITRTMTSKITKLIGQFLGKSYGKIFTSPFKVQLVSYTRSQFLL